MTPAQMLKARIERQMLTPPHRQRAAEMLMAAGVYAPWHIAEHTKTGQVVLMRVTDNSAISREPTTLSFRPENRSAVPWAWNLTKLDDRLCALLEDDYRRTWDSEPEV